MVSVPHPLRYELFVCLSVCLMMNLDSHVLLAGGAPGSSGDPEVCHHSNILVV